MSKKKFSTHSTSPRRSNFWTKIRHIIEVILGYAFIHIPYRYIGAAYVRIITWLIGIIGPLSWAHKRVTDNLTLAMPELSQAEKKAIAKQSWHNIAHIPYDFITAKHNPNALKIKVTGLEHIQNYISEQKNIIFFSGHNACWDIFRIAMASHNIPTAIIYRAFNNAYFDSYARDLMDHGFAPIFQKNPAGIKNMLKYMRSNQGNMLILMDQYLKNGLSIPFFNQPAKTAPSAAELAKKYTMPLVPIFVTRSEIGHYHVIIHPPLETETQSVSQILTDVNKKIEAHIRQYPSEWFWLHRRWK